MDCKHYCSKQIRKNGTNYGIQQ